MDPQNSLMKWSKIAATIVNIILMLKFIFSVVPKNQGFFLLQHNKMFFIFDAHQNSPNVKIGTGQ